jgi:hypothetical protein
MLLTITYKWSRTAHERRRFAREPALKHCPDDMPIACCVTSAELGDRAATLLAQFRSVVIGTEELRDGYAFRVPGDGKWIGLIAELIVAERECCPFLAFEVAALPNMGPVIVRVIGPARYKGVLENRLM